MNLHTRSMLLAGTLSLCACGGANTPTPPIEGNGPGDDVPTEYNELLEMVTANVASTDLSAQVEITSARVEGENGAPPATSGYVNHVYVVDIVTPIYGGGDEKSFTFSEMAEADIAPTPAGTVLIVSVCRGDAAGHFYTPDNGYIFRAEELPASTASDLAAKPPARGDSVCTP